MDKRLADSFQGVSIDVLHIVVDGMPCGAERTLATVGVAGDDVDAGNAGHLVHRTVVVGDGATELVGEETGVATGVGGVPYTLDNLCGILHGDTLAIEAGTLSTHHVEEDAIARLVAVAVEMGRPVLRT